MSRKRVLHLHQIQVEARNLPTNIYFSSISSKLDILQMWILFWYALKINITVIHACLLSFLFSCPVGQLFSFLIYNLFFLPTMLSFFSTCDFSDVVFACLSFMLLSYHSTSFCPLSYHYYYDCYFWGTCLVLINLVLVLPSSASTSVPAGLSWSLFLIFSSPTHPSRKVSNWPNTAKVSKFY